MCVILQTPSCYKWEVWEHKRLGGWPQATWQCWNRAQARKQITWLLVLVFSTTKRNWIKDMKNWFFVCLFYFVLICLLLARLHSYSSQASSTLAISNSVSKVGTWCIEDKSNGWMYKRMGKWAMKSHEKMGGPKETLRLVSSLWFDRTKPLLGYWLSIWWCR